MHLVGFIIRMYHDAQSPEGQNRVCVCVCVVCVYTHTHTHTHTCKLQSQRHCFLLVRFVALGRNALQRGISVRSPLWA